MGKLKERFGLDAGAIVVILLVVYSVQLICFLASL